MPHSCTADGGTLRPMQPWLMILVQLGFAALALHLLRRHVYPSLGHIRQGELIVDVWLPLALVIPLLFLVAGVDGSVALAGWPALGGPILVGLLALVAATVGRDGIGLFGEEFVDGEAIGWRLAPRLTIVALLAGLVLLLLGAAHVMTMWIGQCAFALAAVILWINTPELDRDETQSSSPLHTSAGFGMVAILFCAFAQGMAGRLVGEPWRGAAVALMFAYAAAALLLAARQNSSGLCLRLGIWAASFGVLFGLGVIAILAMLPRVLATWLGLELPPHSMLIAAGFGSFALEATFLMVMTPVAVGLLRVPPWLRWLIGLAVLLFIIIRLALWISASSANLVAGGEDLHGGAPGSSITVHASSIQPRG